MWWQDELLEAPRTGDPVVDDTLLYLELIMQNAEESRHTTSAMQKQINEMHEKTFKEKTAGTLAAEYATNLNEISKAVFGAMGKLQSGDTNQIVIGSMEIVSAVGKFVPVAGPYIQLAAGIIGGLFGLNQQVLPAESTESIVQRVIEEALADARDKELRQQVLGMVNVMRNDNNFLENQLLVHPDTRTEQETFNLRLILANGDYGYNSGVQLMGELLGYIKEDLLTTDEKHADRIAGQMLAYVNLQMLRERQMCALSLLWATLEDNNIMGSMFHVIDQEHKSTADDLHALSVMVATNSDTMPLHVLSSLHTQLSTDERLEVEHFMDRIGKTIPGRAVRLESGTTKACIVPTGARLTLTTNSCGQPSSLFRLYQAGSYGTWTSYHLLSVEAVSFYATKHWDRFLEVVKEDSSTHGLLNWGDFEVRQWRKITGGEGRYTMKHQGLDNNKSILFTSDAAVDNNDIWKIMLDDGTELPFPGRW